MLRCAGKSSLLYMVGLVADGSAKNRNEGKEASLDTNITWVHFDSSLIIAHS